MRKDCFTLSAEEMVDKLKCLSGALICGTQTEGDIGARTLSLTRELEEYYKKEGLWLNG